MTKNLNCPFCNNEPHEGEDYVSCWTVGCCIEGKEIAHQFWNTRHDPLQEKVEEFTNILNHYEVNVDGIEDLIEEFNRIFGKNEK
jgi:hypothetical protein